MKTEKFNIQKPNTQYNFQVTLDDEDISNTIIINSRTVFYVKTSGDNGKDGKTWGTAFKTIDTALGAAAAISPSETNLVEIWVAEGNYKISTAMTMTKFVSIYGSFAGDEITKNDRKILDVEDKEHKLFKSPLKPTTNIIIADNSTSRHFTTSLAAATAITQDSVTIDGICFKNSTITSIYNEYSSPTFSNCVWYNNISSKTDKTITAGAVYNKYSSPKFYNCQFISNEAKFKMGGAIMYDTDIANDAVKSIIDNCVFYNNSSNQDGSAIYANAHNKIKITNSIIDANKTTNNKYGGSVFINDKATVEISNSYIIYNNDILDDTFCGTGVRLKGYVKGGNSATLIANGVTFYQNISLSGTDYDIGRDFYSPTNTNDPADKYNIYRPTIQLTNCNLVGGNIISNYPKWFNSTTSFIKNWSTNINESDVNANRAETKINSNY